MSSPSTSSISRKRTLFGFTVLSIVLFIVIFYFWRAFALPVIRYYATLEGHAQPVRSIAFSPDGKILASGGDDCRIVLWDLSSRTIRAICLGHRKPIRCITFATDGKMLFSGGDEGEIMIWNVENVNRVGSIQGHKGSIRSIVGSPDGDRIVSASDDNTIKVWKIRTQEELLTIQDTEGVWSLGILSANERVFLVAATVLGVNIYDLATGTKVADLGLESHGSIAVATDLKSEFLVTGDLYWRIKLWNSKSLSLIDQINGHSFPVISVSLAPNGKLLASAGWGSSFLSPPEARVWDVETKKPIAVLRGHKLSLTGVVFSPDGTTLATASIDGTVKLWHISR